MDLIFNQNIEDKNFYYLSGIKERCNGIVIFNKKPVVLASPLEAEIAKKYVETRVFHSHDELWNMLSEETQGSEEIGINFAKVSLGLYNHLKNNLNGKFYNISQELMKRRAIKKKGELQEIKMACKIADFCITQIRDFIRPGITELEVKSEIERLASIKGSQRMSFDTIVASGENSAIPHATPTEKKIDEGDVILIDFGPQFNMYSSDMSRTFIIGSNERFKKQYQKVLEAQMAVMDKIESGIYTSTLQKVAEKKIGRMVHLVGHGLGLNVHESPSFNEKGKISEKNVVAIEPGIYKKFGIRIEDTVYFNKGPKVLMKAPKDIDFAII